MVQARVGPGAEGQGGARAARAEGQGRGPEEGEGLSPAAEDGWR